MAESDPLPMPVVQWVSSEAEWDNHKARIWNLYLGDDKPLKDVMFIMQHEHGFKASVKMYKNHITKWGFDKKNKKPEIVAIVRKRKQRADQGKDSVFHIRGRIVDMEDAERYLKRKRISIEDAVRQAAATPPDLACFTPEWLPGSPSTPEDIWRPEAILILVRNYVIGSFQAGTWVSSEKKGLVSTKAVRSRRRKMAPIYDFWNSATIALDFFSHGSFQHAGLFLTRASACILDILKEEHPKFLQIILQSLYAIIFRKRDDVNRILLGQFSAMAEIVLPELHPLHGIFAFLSSMDSNLAELVFAKAWEGWAELFAQAGGLNSIDALTGRLAYIRHIQARQDPGIAEASLRSLARQFKDADRRYNRGYILICTGLARYLIDVKRFEEAEVWAKELLRNSNLDVRLKGTEALAHIQRGKGDHNLAEVTLQGYINKRISKYGEDDSNGLLGMTKLERWLRESGKADEAAEVSARISELLHRSSAII